MKISPYIQVPVLIAGAGPTGLTAAITLARHGIDSLVVERRSSPSEMPRANLVSTGSMELFRSWGLSAELEALAADARFTGFIGETLAAPGDEFPLGVPSPEQAAIVSPSVPLCVGQDGIEPVMLRHLRSLTLGSVEFGTELVSLENVDGGVRARVHGPGGERTVEAGYLIGADGVRSRVRSELGLGLSGPGQVGDAAAAVVDVSLDHALGPVPRHIIYSITNPDAPGGVFATVGRGDRWVYGYAGESGTVDPRDVNPAEIERRIRASVGAPVGEVRVGSFGRFAYAAEIADSFRAGHAFLAGDAAHRVTPRGGTGMNTAIRDGRDLAWKLAWVLRGWAGDELLDSYERERRPVAEHNMARSVDPSGSDRAAAEEMHVDLGPRIPHVWIEPGRSTLDLLGDGFTLLLGPHADWRPPEQRAPVAEHRLDAMTARAIGLGERGALLVRPDGVAADAWLDWPAPAAERQATAV